MLPALSTLAACWQVSKVLLAAWLRSLWLAAVGVALSEDWPGPGEDEGVSFWKRMARGLRPASVG